MKRLTKNLLISILIISILGLNSVYAASNDVNEIDEFLLETGMPLDVVEALDEDFKAYIYETIDKTQELTFSGYTEKTITFPNTDDRGIRINYIPTSELSLTVVSVREANSGVYYIYPTFEWKIVNKVANDTFAFVLPEGWYLVANKYNLRMYKAKSYGNWETVEDLSRPSTANFYGYAWQIPQSSSYSQYSYYKGHAYFYAKPTTSTPDKRICISYTDDTTFGASATYTLTFGPLSISITPNSGTIRTTSEILEF